MEDTYTITIVIKPNQPEPDISVAQAEFTLTKDELHRDGSWMRGVAYALLDREPMPGIPAPVIP